MGSDTDMVLNALKFFPVATGADFRDTAARAGRKPADAAKPTTFDEFAAAILGAGRPRQHGHAGELRRARNYGIDALVRQRGGEEASGALSNAARAHCH